jgi:hypothetical protein
MTHTLYTFEQTVSAFMKCVVSGNAMVLQCPVCTTTYDKQDLDANLQDGNEG